MEVAMPQPEPWQRGGHAAELDERDVVPYV